MSVLTEDLDGILERARDDLHAFRGARLFITGGTGFVGTWLLWSIAHANAQLGTHITCEVLTRDPQAFERREPALLENPGLRFVRGDVRDGAVSGTCDGIIHAATPASAALNEARPGEMLATIVEGQRNVLALAARNGAVPLLFTSSGAVYGRQPPEVPRLSEDDRGGPDPLDQRSAYHEGKRTAELMSAIAIAADGVPVKVARLFAFVGPYLHLERHFAVGNFLRDALNGGPIVVRGDGTTLRSYLYAADMIVWLWAIFARGRAGRAYNVGSERAVTIAELARACADASGDAPEVRIEQSAVPGRPAERYVPDTTRAREELRLAETVDLAQALRRSFAWHRERNRP